MAIWVLVTNLIGLISAYMFFGHSKGSAISVIGSICWLSNILQAIVLFVYAQVWLFSDDVQSCSALVHNPEIVSYTYQLATAHAQVALAYLKIMVVVVALLFHKCCVSELEKNANSETAKAGYGTF